MKQKQSFHEFLLDGVANTPAKGVINLFVKYKREPIVEADVDINWVIRFSEYLDERGSSANTKKLYTGIMRAALKRARRRGYVLNLDFEDVAAETKVKPEASESVFLNVEELKLVEAYKPTGKLDKYARAMFLLCAYTGCRASDADILSEYNMNNDELNYTSIKTKQTSRMPLHPLVPSLLNEVKGKVYDEDSVRTIIAAQMKLICERVGINELVTLYRRGERMTKPKFQMVGSHTARKSFATNMLLDGYSLEQISRMMGHTDPKMTMKYICISYTDEIVGSKTYLQPIVKDKLFEQYVAMIDLGLEGWQVRANLLIMGVQESEIDRVSQKYTDQNGGEDILS